MRIIVEKNYEEMSKTVRDMLLGEMYLDKEMHISITAGTTPERLYELLVEDLKDKTPITNVTFYNFDEIPYKEAGGAGVTMENLNRMFFDPAGIDRKQIHELDETNYKGHDKLLAEIGGFDSLFLGLGADGHYVSVK